MQYFFAKKKAICPIKISEFIHLIILEIIMLIIFLNYFSGYGTSMCCSRIRVTLNGVVKDKQGGLAGTYQKANGLKNSRSHWIDGDQALWFDISNNVWMIGYSSDLGSNTGGIILVQDSACPTSDNQFKYVNTDDETGFRIAPINTVSIQCA